MRRRLFFSLILLLGSKTSILSQNQASNWAFGNQFLLNFSEDGTVKMGKTPMVASEGNSSISDQCGNLILYSNGESIWNGAGQIIADSIGGNASSSQGTIIVPRPGGFEHFYIFTADAVENNFNNGLRYVEVVIDDENPQGLILDEGFLYDNDSESVTAVYNSELDFYWILTVAEQPDYNDLVAFKLESEGINKSPVITDSKVFLSRFNNIEASPSGGKLLLKERQNTLIISFDKSSGNILGKNLFPGSRDFAWLNEDIFIAVEYNNERMLFDLYSYRIDRQLNIMSKKFLKETEFDFVFQLGPDGYFYFHKGTGNLIGRFQIDNNGTLRGFQENFLDFESTVWGPWPNIPKNLYSETLLEVEIVNFCDSIGFEIRNSSYFNNFQWQFGDENSPTNFSNSSSPTHIYTSTGKFEFEVSAAYKCGRTLNLRSEVNVYSKPNLSLKGDTIIVCENSLPYTLSVSESFGTNYRWNYKFNSSSIEVTEEGWHILRASNPCATEIDSIYLQVAPSGEFKIPNVIYVCEGNPILDLRIPGNYLWSDGTTQNILQVQSEGEYWVQISNPCGNYEFNFQVNFTSDILTSSIPNVFTPNGDGYNDLFEVRTPFNESNRLTIVDRWGKTVFKSEGLNLNWDGTIDNSHAAQGIYYYVLETYDCLLSPRKVKGIISLIK
jgi:gliding motility-associated-like protein